MTEFTIIACIGKNYELGNNGDLIYHIKEDLNFFRNYTNGKKIVMGMKTFKSLPKLLPNRTHIVLTRQNITLPELTVLHSIEEAYNYLKLFDEEIMIIGGSSIYKEFLRYASKMILTEVESEEEADTYFPRFNKEEWNTEIININSSNAPKYKRLVYTRK